jgi:hypothetical protein
MATELLSLRLSPELMASVRALAKKRQVSMTAAATTLINTSLTAADTSALLNSQLTAAQAEIDRLKKAASQTSSPKSTEGRDDWKKLDREHDKRREQERQESQRARESASARAPDTPPPSPSCSPEEFAGVDGHTRPSRDRRAALNEEIRFRLSIAIKGTIVGWVLFVIVLIPMPYDWWLPRLVAEVAMGKIGQPEEAAARLHGGPMRAGDMLMAVYTVMHTGSNPERLAACFNAANERFGYHALGAIVCEIEVPGPLSQYDLMTQPAPDGAPLGLVDEKAAPRKPANKGKR